MMCKHTYLKTTVLEARIKSTKFIMALANVLNKINGNGKSVNVKVGNEVKNARPSKSGKPASKPEVKGKPETKVKPASKKTDVEMYEPRWLGEDFQFEVVEVDGRAYFQLLMPIDTIETDEEREHEHEHGYSENGFRLSKPSEYTGVSKSENLASTGGMALIHTPKEMKAMFKGRQIYVSALVTSPLKGNDRLKI